MCVFVDVPQSKIDWIKASAKDTNSISKKTLRRVGELQRNATALEKDVTLASKSDEILGEIRESRKYRNNDDSVERMV